MVGWIILGVLVGLIILILLIPVGADIRYEDEVIRIYVTIAGFKLQLIPKKKKEPKPEKPKEEEAPKPEAEEPKPKKEKKKLSISLNAEEIIDLLKLLLHELGCLLKKPGVDRFVLHWIATGDDPYLTARAFAVVNAGLSQLAPLCTERFHCPDSSVWTELDFTRENTFFEFGLSMYIRIGQVLASGISLLVGALKILLRSRRRVKREAKEERKALEKWLSEHPEDAARYEAELREAAAAQAETQDEAAQTEAELNEEKSA